MALNHLDGAENRRTGRWQVESLPDRPSGFSAKKRRTLGLPKSGGSLFWRLFPFLILQYSYYFFKCGSCWFSLLIFLLFFNIPQCAFGLYRIPASAPTTSIGSRSPCVFLSGTLPTDRQIWLTANPGAVTVLSGLSGWQEKACPRKIGTAKQSRMVLGYCCSVNTFPLCGTVPFQNRLPD